MRTTLEFTAPRFEEGEWLGRFPVEIVRPLAFEGAFLVRFADGHEAAVYEYELMDNAEEEQR